MRKIKFTSNTIRENQNNINDNFDDIEKVAQEIVESVDNVNKKIPTKTSQLTNDGDGVSDFDTVLSVNSKVSNLKQYVNDELSETVTLNTEQKIPATKTFEKIRFDHDINIELVQSSTNGNTNIIIGDADGQNGEKSIVIGASNYSNLTGEYNVIIGNNSKSTGNSVVVGKGCKSDGNYNVNVGILNTNESESSVSIGTQLKTQGSTAVNIGYHGRVYNNDGISIGNFSVSASENAIAIGKNALSGAKDAIQLGSGSNSKAKSLQVFEYELLDENGKIPEDRLPETIDAGYVDEKISELVNSAPETLDTLGELATAIQENESVVDAINQSISQKANKTEIPKSTSQLTNDGDGTSNFVTEQFVENAINNIELPSTVVETNTVQSITGTKTFNKIEFSSDHVNIGSNTPNNETLHSVSIGNESKTNTYGVSVGYGAESQTESVALGVFAIGRNKGVGLGSSAYALDDNIQIGYGQNQKAKTLQVYDYELLDANGKIPAERLPEGTGGAELPENLVTTDTDQNITGTKTFDKVAFSDDVVLEVPTSTNKRIRIGEKTVARDTYCVSIGNNTNAGGLNSIAIGVDSSTTNNANGVAIGNLARTSGMSAIAIGNSPSSSGNGVALGYYADASSSGIGIGYYAKSTAKKAIQLGQGTNSTQSTFQVFDYQVLDANGQIPIERLENVTSLIETSITGVLNTEV